MGAGAIHTGTASSKALHHVHKIAGGNSDGNFKKDRQVSAVPSGITPSSFLNLLVLTRSRHHGLQEEHSWNRGKRR